MWKCAAKVEQTPKGRKQKKNTLRSYLAYDGVANAENPFMLEAVPIL